MEIFKLNKKNKCVFAIKLAERASRYIVDTEKLTLINNAIEIALTFVQTEKGNGEVLYNFLDNENNGFTIFQEMEIDEKIRGAWDCIIDAIAYITKEIYLVNGEKYFPEPIEMVDDTIFIHMINALKLCSSMEAPFKGPLEVSLSNLEHYVPSSYYSKVKAYVKSHPDDQEKIFKRIQQLYTNYDNDVKATVQNHHWIEQCILNKTDDYPFLKCPPMKKDLYTWEENLTLIVGHNGPHSVEYTGKIEDKLNETIERLDKMFPNGWNEICDNMNHIRYEEFKKYVNKRIEIIIHELKSEVKAQKDLINSSSEIFILEEIN